MRNEKCFCITTKRNDYGGEFQNELTGCQYFWHKRVDFKHSSFKIVHPS